jgi:predicted RNA-binding protein with EMAP domain
MGDLKRIVEEFSDTTFERPDKLLLDFHKKFQQVKYSIRSLKQLTYTLDELNDMDNIKPEDLNAYNDMKDIVNKVSDAMEEGKGNRY